MQLQSQGWTRSGHEPTRAHGTKAPTVCLLEIIHAQYIPGRHRIACDGDALPVSAEQATPTSAKALQIEALVNKAAAVIQSNGKAAFSQFREKDSEWFKGDTYLFVYDLKSNVLLNAAFPAREGTNTTGQKDANGKLFHHDFINMAETKGAGWVDYMFPKPGQTQPARKWAYVKAVTVDGVPSLVASGFYPE
jgi:cytochrome c